MGIRLHATPAVTREEGVLEAADLRDGDPGRGRDARDDHAGPRADELAVGPGAHGGAVAKAAGRPG